MIGKRIVIIGLRTDRDTFERLRAVAEKHSREIDPPREARASDPKDPEPKPL